MGGNERALEKAQIGKNKFRCSYCEKTFTQVSWLKVHERTHTGERPFSCSECDKKFKQPKSLKLHERTHTGEKPYTCSQCDQKFKRLDSLKKHMGSHSESKAASSIQDVKEEQSSLLIQIKYEPLEYTHSSS